jgi:hypothetical protein
MISTAQQELEDGLYDVLNNSDIREAVERFQGQPAEKVAEVMTQAMFSVLGPHIRLLEAAHPNSTLCTESAFRNAMLRLVKEWRAI